jgi:creatinine amidohydrolase/Fe(II)-dependent formamide hydrolase-like protein
MSEALRRARRAAGVALLLAATLPAHAAADSVFLEELTSTELRERIGGGTVTALLPIGGTEQNGAHMVLGKHNVRVRALAGRIAERLGNAVVAPVIAYVPEGTIEPPTSHMRWAGTITLPEPVFEATLEAAARSLRRHGFAQVVLLGDHGGYQAAMQRASERVNRESRPAAVFRMLALRQYYRAATTDFAAMLRAEGFADAEIGQHAGLADTALALAVDSAIVRPAAMAAAPQAGSGVSGDQRRASAALGQRGLDHIVDVSVSAIRQLPPLSRPKPTP